MDDAGQRVLCKTEQRQRRDGQLSRAAQADGELLERAAVLPDPPVAGVLAGGVRIHPARAVVLEELPDVVDLGDDARRAARVGLVVGDLERESALAAAD